MARTVTTIYNEMLAEKAKYSSLDSLTNSTSVAIWKSIMYACAVVMASFEQIQDVFKSELLEQASKLPIGTTKWYAQKALDYQEGYSLFYNRNNGGFEYQVVDETAKINKVSSCVSEGGNIVIKVAKDNGSGSLTNLTEPQIVQVYNYFQTIKVVGPLLKVLSLSPDLMRLNIKIKVDNTKINNLGQSVTSITTYPIEDAINLHIGSFSLQTFGSELTLLSIIDAIQAVDGVLNVKVNECKAKSAGDVVFTDVLANELNTYYSIAGYLTIDPSYTLRNNITYI